MRRSPSASPLPRSKSPKASRSPVSTAGAASGGAAAASGGRGGGCRRGGLRGGEAGVAGVQRTRLVEQCLHLGLLAAMVRPLGGVEEALDVGGGLVALTGHGGEACQLGIGGDRLPVGGGELQGLFEAPRLDQLAQARPEVAPAPGRRRGGRRALGRCRQLRQIVELRQVVEDRRQAVEVEVGVGGEPATAEQLGGLRLALGAIGAAGQLGAQVVHLHRAVAALQAVLERLRRAELGVELEDEVATQRRFLPAAALGEPQGLLEGGADALLDLGGDGGVAGVGHQIGWRRLGAARMPGRRCKSIGMLAKRLRTRL